MSTVLTESLQRAGCFLSSEANKTRSRALGILAMDADNVLVAGTVLGRIGAVGAASSAAKAGGNTGNGVMGAVTAGGGSQAGVYTLRVTAAASNAGSFVVKDPQGDVVGEGTVAVAFSGGGLSFTLADGATDFIVGDGFDITVAHGATPKYTVLDLTNTAGGAVAAAILFDGADASAADVKIAVVDDDAEVLPSRLVWPAGFTTEQKNTAYDQLRALGIKLALEY
jgi:head decoration protein D